MVSSRSKGVVTRSPRSRVVACCRSDPSWSTALTMRPARSCAAPASSPSRHRPQLHPPSLPLRLRLERKASASRRACSVASSPTEARSAAARHGADEAARRAVTLHARSPEIQRGSFTMLELNASQGAVATVRTWEERFESTVAIEIAEREHRVCAGRHDLKRIRAFDKAGAGTRRRTREPRAPAPRQPSRPVPATRRRGTPPSDRSGTRWARAPR